MIIGICGKSGSGKTTLASEIKKITTRKVVHLEMDKVGHNVLAKPELKDILVRSFGKSIIVNGTVDRKKVGEIVFSSHHEMDKLTEITWNEMQKDINRFLEENRNNIIILDWLLLPKTQYFNMCDIKILLDIPYEVRKQRAMKRDHITSEAFDLREKATMEYESSNFDYVVKENINEVTRKIGERI